MVYTEKFYNPNAYFDLNPREPKRFVAQLVHRKTGVPGGCITVICLPPEAKSKIGYEIVRRGATDFKINTTVWYDLTEEQKEKYAKEKEKKKRGR